MLVVSGKGSRRDKVGRGIGDQRLGGKRRGGRRGEEVMGGGEEGGGGRRGEEGCGRGRGELPVSVVVAVYCPDWLLLIAGTEVPYSSSPMLLGEGRGRQSTNRLRDFL